MQTTTQGPINPRFIQARRRAARFDHPHLDYPTYVRKGLTPKVEIGILRDPAQPITISPSLTMPKEPESGIDWHLIVGGVSAVCLVSLFFVGV